MHPALEIPPSIKPVILPDPKLSVLNLIRFRTPIGSRVDDAPLSINPNLFSEAPSSIDARLASIIPGLRPPTLDDLQACFNGLPEAISAGHKSFNYPKDDLTLIKLPFWVLEYWRQVAAVSAIKIQWTTAEEYMKSVGAHHVIDKLSEIPWGYILDGSWGLSITDLAQFCSRNWLSSGHVDIMVQVMNNQLSSYGIKMVEVLDSCYNEKIVRQYRYNPDNYLPDKSAGHLKVLGQQLADGRLTRAAFCIPVWVGEGPALLPGGTGPERGNHWTAATIDVPNKCIFYADTLGFDIPNELEAALTWWLANHIAGSFTLSRMACSQQDDGFSCAVLAANAIMHLFCGNQVPLIQSSAEAMATRVTYLVNFVDLQKNKHASSIQMGATSPVASASMSVTSAVIPVSNSFEPGLKRGTTKRPPPEPMSIAPLFHTKKRKDDAVRQAAPSPHQTAGARPENAKMELSKHDETETDPEPDENEDEDQEAEKYDPAIFVDLPDRPVKSKKGGAPRKLILERLTQLCHRKDDPSDRRYRCIGTGCRYSWKKRSSTRVLRHATECTKLDVLLQQEARNEAASKAPSRKLTVEEVITDQKGGKSVIKKAVEVHNAVDLFEKFKDKGLKERHKAADLAIVQLFCAAGIPPYLANRPEWQSTLQLLCPSYKPANRSKLEEQQIVEEAANVRNKAIAILQQQDNLTLSYDGGTTRGRDAFWTIHVSTENHKVYLLEGSDATDVSHSARWIRDFAMKVINEIGPTRFAAIVSDSTGNTRLSRDLLAGHVNLVFNIPDICHHLSNALKDIVKLDHFKPVISTLRGVIAKFHRSHIGTAEFNTACAELKITRGLEAIGKTRFGTIIRAARALEKCLPVIKRVVERGVFNLEASIVSYSKYFSPRPSQASASFQIALRHLIDIGSPALKAITCLEANEALPGDVCLYWHSFLHETDAVIDNLINQQELPADVAHELYGILNHRHRELFVEGRISTAADLYYTGVYLDPAYLHLSPNIYRTDPLEQSSQIDLTGIEHPKAFRQVAMFLMDVAVNEINHGSKASLVLWKNRGTEFSNKFLAEFQRYARKQYPYDTVIEDGQSPLHWWASIEGTEFAKILPVLARKIFAVRVNSMPEERTVSSFTWLTSPLRANMMVSSMVNMTKIRQYYQTEQKARANSLPVPRMLYVDARKKLKEKMHESGFNKDEEDDSWLDDKPGDENEAAKVSPEVALEARMSSLINFDCKLLSGILSDTRPAKTLTTENKSATLAISPQQEGIIDNNFCLNI